MVHEKQCNMAKTEIIASTEPVMLSTYSSYEPQVGRTMDGLASKAMGTMESCPFNAATDLEYNERPTVYTMEDLGLAKEIGISPVAVSQPFKLFSDRATERFRKAILRPEVRDNYTFSSTLAPCQLRGYATEQAPFIHQAWNDPRTLAILSEIAGVDLIPVMDYEIGHINISEKKGQQKTKFSTEDDRPIVDWHEDSYPFVCVMMLSDCTGMIGGETALKTGHGNVLKIRGPEKGYAVVLQGRYILHQALNALGQRERISMVTSFRPRDPELRDDSVLTTVRPISDLSELYYGFGEYRLEILQQRVKNQLRSLRADRECGKRVDVRKLKTFLCTQEEFIVHTNKEIVGQESVTQGRFDEAGLSQQATCQETSGKRKRISWEWELVREQPIKDKKKKQA